MTEYIAMHPTSHKAFWDTKGALLLLTATAVLPHGYHLGHQDGAIYLPAIKKILDPALYPYDAAFFLAQTRWTVFSEIVALSARLTRLPLDLVIFLWHLLTIFLVLLACWQLSQRCFAKPATQWAAVLTVWTARLMPVTGTQLNLMDRYLHPRDLTLAALLFALVALLDRRPGALAWIALAAVTHPTMAVFGTFHLGIQGWKSPRWVMALFLPLLFFGALLWSSAGGDFAPGHNQAWHEVLASRPYLFPLRWHWYEWVGVAVPLALLTRFGQIAERHAASVAARISRRVVAAGILGVAGAVLISTVPALEHLIPAEPMRTLHFVYVFFVFVGGGLLGEHVLRDRPSRWLLFFVSLCTVFFLSNRLVYRASPHIEWPGRAPKNVWVEAFDWIRRNTPRDALFALEPRHMLRPGEDSHGFRAFAERSMLADWVKDRAVSALEPGLAYQWRAEVRVRERWQEFGAEEFHRLKNEYGVSWIVLNRQHPALAPRSGLGTSIKLTSKAGAGVFSCPYVNEVLAVCRIN